MTSPENAKADERLEKLWDSQMEKELNTEMFFGRFRTAEPQRRSPIRRIGDWLADVIPPSIFGRR